VVAAEVSATRTAPHRLRRQQRQCHIAIAHRGRTSRSAPEGSRVDPDQSGGVADHAARHAVAVGGRRGHSTGRAPPASGSLVGGTGRSAQSLQSAGLGHDPAGVLEYAFLRVVVVAVPARAGLQQPATQPGDGVQVGELALVSGGGRAGWRRARPGRHTRRYPVAPVRSQVIANMPRWSAGLVAAPGRTFICADTNERGASQP